MKSKSLTDDCLCLCGCGQKTKISPRNCSTFGWVKGQPRKYVHGHNSRRKSADYEHILTAGTLKEDGLNIPQIAAKFYPRKQRSRIGRKQSRDAIRKTLKQFHNLVNGGHRTITLL